MVEYSTEDGYQVNLPISFKGYRYKKIIGSGSTSIVCLVEEENSGQLYSAKIIPKIYINEKKLAVQISNEIFIMKKLDHPNIVKFHDSFEFKNDENNSYIVIIMEYCENGDLYSLISNNGFENKSQELSIMFGILNAIKYLHSFEIAHGDIKPENILLDNNFNPKLSDFGYCKTQKIMGEESKNGSLYYASPELFKKGKFNTLKSDIWSLGILFYILSEKRFPFKKGDETFIVNQIVNRKIKLDSDIPDKLRSIVDRCTQLDPKNRPNIEELLKDDYFFDEKTNDNYNINDFYSDDADQFFSDFQLESDDDELIYV